MSVLAPAGTACSCHQASDGLGNPARLLEYHRVTGAFDHHEIRVLDGGGHRDGMRRRRHQVGGAAQHQRRDLRENSKRVCLVIDHEGA